VLEMMAHKQKEQHREGHVRGCYFGNFTLELSTTSQAIRDKVKSIFQQYNELIESLLIMARDTGEIARQIDPAQLSLVILGQLEGAILLDKANQQPQHVDNSIAFIKQFLTS
jgi:TetR/AcrR family transcriptional repressor of nem operon